MGQKIEHLIDQQGYESDEICQAVLNDAKRLGNVEKIERGELVLPHPVDAKEWFERQQQENAKQRQ